MRRTPEGRILYEDDFSYDEEDFPKRRKTPVCGGGGTYRETDRQADDAHKKPSPEGSWGKRTLEESASQ